MTAESAAPLIVSLFALAMSLAFVLADRGSATSRMLALFLFFFAVSIGVNVLIAHPLHVASGVPAWDGVFAWPEVAAGYFAFVQEPIPEDAQAGPVSPKTLSRRVYHRTVSYL